LPVEGKDSRGVGCRAGQEESRSPRKPISDRPRLLELGVSGLGFLEDGDIGVCVFPQGEEILIGYAALGGVARKSVGTRQAQTRQRVEGRNRIDTTVVKDLAELDGGLRAVPRTEVGQAPNIDGGKLCETSELIGARRAKQLNGFGGVAAPDFDRSAGRWKGDVVQQRIRRKAARRFVDDRLCLPGGAG